MSTKKKVAAAIKVKDDVISSDEESDVDAESVENSDDSDFDNTSESDGSYETDASDDESDDSSVKSRITQTSDKSSCRSKVNTSKNIFKIYKQNRERVIENMLKNEKYEELEVLGIDLSEFEHKSAIDKNFENLATNAYARVCYPIILSHNKEKSKNLEEELTSVWDHPVFKIVKEQFYHESDIITNPPQIVEGGFECPKCSSSKTITYSKQLKAADENTSVFIKCMNIHCMKVTRIS